MKTLLRLLAVACVAGWAGPAWAASYRAQIKDHAHLYSAEGKAQALKLARQIAEEHKLDVVVETLEPLPEAERKALPHLNLKELHAKLMGRTRERARQADIDGVYAVIYTRPRATCVVVWPPQREQQLTSADLEDVRRQLAGSRGSLWSRWTGGDVEDHDRALLAGLERLQAILQHPPRRPAVGVLTVGFLMLPFLGVWLVLVLIRARLNALARGQASPVLVSAGEPPTSPTAGVAVLLGAMFGTPAAQRAYDELLEGNPAAAAAPPLLPPHEPPAEAPPERVHAGEELPGPPADENAPHSPVV
jgi:hypothetical protein